MTTTRSATPISLADDFLQKVVALTDRDGEIALNARDWTGSLTLLFGEREARFDVVAGQFSVAGSNPTVGVGLDIVIAGTEEHWSAMLAPVPPPGLTDPLGAVFLGMTVQPSSLPAERHLAVRRFTALMRHAYNDSDPTPPVILDSKPHGTFDAAHGRYVHLHVDGMDHRVYFEEAGQGIGLICQHTAGADARQWRHLLEDERITSRFRVIAYDLPYHGKSLPPSGVAWWAQEYRLTRDHLMKFPIALASALGIFRPAFIGSSVGGMLALDLARYYPDEFRAVISCEGALYAVPDHAKTHGDDDRPVLVGSDPAKHAASMMSFMGAIAPEAYRQETRLHYAQGAPGVFLGDIAYFSGDHDLRGQGHLIDTDRCPVHMLTGEYDYLTVPQSQIAAAEIPGATLRVMPQLGHFPMSEDPARFAEYLLPVLDRIAAE